MTIRLTLPVEIEEQVREMAAQEGLETADYICALVQQHLTHQKLKALHDRKQPTSIEELNPMIAPPPGMNWLQCIRGTWPGDESDEEINRLLEEMS